jgi:hypothetical protein|nr:MAG TPA: hypothetical protein [Caudoviricetes sp.]
MNRLIQRIYSAMENQETPVLDQIANDIQEAREKGSIETSQYRIDNLGNGKVVITDSENGEKTLAEDAGSRIKLDKYEGDGNVYISNKKFYLIDDEGKVRAINSIRMIRPLLKINPNWTMLSREDFNSKFLNSEGNSGDLKVFSKFHRKYAVSDGTGKFLGYFNKFMAKNMTDENPDYSMTKAVEYGEKNQAEPKVQRSKFKIVN